jgi:hypothetical protein
MQRAPYKLAVSVIRSTSYVGYQMDISRTGRPHRRLRDHQEALFLRVWYVTNQWQCCGAAAHDGSVKHQDDVESFDSILLMGPSSPCPRTLPRMFDFDSNHSIVEPPCGAAGPRAAQKGGCGLRKECVTSSGDKSGGSRRWCRLIINAWDPGRVSQSGKGAHSVVSSRLSEEATCLP